MILPVIVAQSSQLLTIKNFNIFLPIAAGQFVDEFFLQRLQEWYPGQKCLLLHLLVTWILNSIGCPVKQRLSELVCLKRFLQVLLTKK